MSSQNLSEQDSLPEEQPDGGDVVNSFRFGVGTILVDLLYTSDYTTSSQQSKTEPEIIYLHGYCYQFTICFLSMFGLEFPPNSSQGIFWCLAACVHLTLSSLEYTVPCEIKLGKILESLEHLNIRLFFAYFCRVVFLYFCNLVCFIIVKKIQNLS